MNFWMNVYSPFSQGLKETWQAQAQHKQENDRGHKKLQSSWQKQLPAFKQFPGQYVLAATCSLPFQAIVTGNMLFSLFIKRGQQRREVQIGGPMS